MADNEINRDSIRKKAENTINVSAGSIVDQILSKLSEEDNLQLHFGKNIGRSASDIDRRDLDEINSAIKESVTSKLAERGIKALFLSDSDFPESMRTNGWGCCISLIKEITVA